MDYRYPDTGDDYHEPSVPDLEATSDPAPARVDGDGGGIPLSWDDE